MSSFHGFFSRTSASRLPTGRVKVWGSRPSLLNTFSLSCRRLGPAPRPGLSRSSDSLASHGPVDAQMDFGSPSRSFPACVPRGRDRPRPRPTSQEAGQERLACLPPPCPPGSAPPGLALEYTSQGAWSQDTWGTRPRAAATRPSPSLRWGCLSWPFLLALFSFTFLFVGGWDSLGSRRPGKPQLICLWPQRPDARDGSRVTAPAPLHCLPPLTLQPGVDGGTELGFSASGGEVLVAGKGKGIFPESLRLGPLPALAGPTRLPAD